MQLVRFIPPPPQPDSIPVWPNKESYLGFACLILTCGAENFCSLLKLADCKIRISRFILVGHCILRPISIIQACRKRNYYKVAFDILSLSMIILSPRFGSIATIMIDGLAESINLENHFRDLNNYRAARSKEAVGRRLMKRTRRHDPKDPKGARQIFDIPENGKLDRQFLAKEYHIILREIEAKRIAFHGAGIYFYQEMIDDLNAAYQTLDALIPEETN